MTYPYPFILSSGHTLYHSTINPSLNLTDIKNESKNEQFLWTSFDQEQSQLHIFNNCDRYESINVNGIWPYCYQLITRRDVKLLPLFIKSAEHYLPNRSFTDLNEMVNFMPSSATSTTTPTKKEMLMTLTAYVQDLEINVPMPDHCHWNDFMGDCNVRILQFLVKLNELNKLDYDGYICVNDQREIALINPHSIFHVDEIIRRQLINVIDMTTHQPVPILYCTTSMDLDQYKHVFNTMFPVFEIIVDEGELQPAPERSMELTGDPALDLVRHLTDFKFIHNAKNDHLDLDLDLDLKQIFLNDEHIALLTEYLGAQCDTIISPNLYQYVFHRYGTKGLTEIFKYHLCPNIKVNYINHMMKMSSEINNIHLIWE